MRHGKLLAVWAVLITAGCSSTEPLEDMVGYVPPTSLPAQPKRTLVADPPAAVWNRLVAFLEASAFEIDHIDQDENLLVARYSGDPSPYIDCGSIVTHQNGTLDQIAGSASAVALNYDIDDQPVILNRRLNLDSRIIIRLAARPEGTVIKTDTTYVVTKTIDVADLAGNVREGNRETVSFEAGGRGEFSKGTACQPNGSLDLAVLQSLPNIVGTDDIDRAELEDDPVETVGLPQGEDEISAARPDSAPLSTAAEPWDEAEVRSGDGGEVEALDAATAPPLDNGDYDWVLPEQGLPTAALPAPRRTDPDPAPPATDSAAIEAQGDAPAGNDPSIGAGDRAAGEPVDEHIEQAAADAADIPAASGFDTGDESPANIVDDTTRKLLDSLDCSGEEWHFCDLVEITTPYRKRNIEKLFGLTVNTTESFTSQVVGRDLKLDILFPSFPSRLHIAYARRDGTIEHVLSSAEVWPPDLAHQLAQADQTIPGPPGLAMIIAIASDEPLFPAPPAEAEDAAAYIDRLKRRLAELDAAGPDGPLAASQLLIYVENADT